MFGPMLAGDPRRAFCRTGLGVLALAFVLGAATPASAVVFQSTAAQTAGLGAGKSFLNAEAMLVISYSNGTQAGCSGSLLSGGAYILTAAHCVTGDTGTLTATSVSVTFANANNLTVTSSTYTVDPTWNGSVANGGDLALISLATPITTITGYVLDTVSSAVGDTVTVAGYGETGTGTTGAESGTFGTLYYGTNIYLGTYSNISSVYGYAFSATGPEAVLIAPGDSGGASLVEMNGVWEIVGVHDFVTCTTNGCSATSVFGNDGGDTSVYANAAWLDSVLVPEPASLLLLAGSVAGAVAGRRRVRRREA